MIDTTPDGNLVIKYYDENQDLIAARGTDGELYPSEAYMNDDLGFLSEINELDIEQGLSLNELDDELMRVAKALGISKSDILSMSEVELDKIIKEKDSLGLDLSNNNNLSDEEKAKQNEATLDSLTAKQEIDLTKKIDNRITLAEVLGVPAGSKLIVVDSTKIQDNENTTRFSCVIKTPNGEVQSADMLDQVGGKDSDKNVYETNRDGSVVEKQNVQSSFAIDSPLIKNGILTIRIGQMGTVEVGYGQMDRTSHNDAFTQILETRERYPVTKRVRDEFNQNKGLDNVSNKMDEIKKHEEHGCNNMTLAEADGNPHTGHIHSISENAAEVILSDENVGSIIDDIYTPNEVAERFEHIQEKYPDKDFDELVEITKNELSSEAEHMHGMDRTH